MAISALAWISKTPIIKPAKQVCEDLLVVGGDEG